MLRTGILRKGARIYHLKRKGTYKVLNKVKIKTNNTTDWVDGYTYQCEQDGKIYSRPLYMFNGFIEIPQKTIWERIKCFFSNYWICYCHLLLQGCRYIQKLR